MVNGRYSQWEYHLSLDLKPNTMLGTVNIDGTNYTFMGNIEGQKNLQQVDVRQTALSTIYIFEGAGIRLTARFTTPLLLDDLKLVSRPISYLTVSAVSLDGRHHHIEAALAVSEEICLDTKGQFDVTAEVSDINGYPTVSIGSVNQPVLDRSGDDIRIDWGYFYLSAQKVPL